MSGSITVKEGGCCMLSTTCMYLLCCACAVSCPGRCEHGDDDDAASESDTRSPRSPWQQHVPSPARSPSPQLSPSRHSRMFGAEGSYLMAGARAEEQHW